jgi:hypothetical protein
MNAITILRNTPPNNYFGTTKNLTFHNLNTKNQLPLDAHLLLGLGLKYIATPKINIATSQLNTSLDRLDRDIGLKVFFSGTDNDDDTYNTHPDIRVKYIWRAPLLQQEIKSCLSRFKDSIHQHFASKHHIPNITHFQQHF